MIARRPFLVFVGVISATALLLVGVAYAASPPSDSNVGTCWVRWKADGGQKDAKGGSIGTSTLELGSLHNTLGQCKALLGSPTTTTTQPPTTTTTSPTTTTTSPTTTTTQPPGGGLPSSKLDLSRWKLTLPINTAHSGNPDEIFNPELNGYSSPRFFFVSPAGNSVIFRTPVADADVTSTTGSSYPRTELRELLDPPSEEGNGWSTTSGTHTMTITQRINHIPDVKRHLVAGQIHDDSDDVLVLRLEGSKLFVDHNGNAGPTITNNYVLGTTFTIQFRVTGGHIFVTYNGTQVDDFPKAGNGMYFKAGAYPQSNVSKGETAGGGAYGEVEIFALTVTHS